MNTRYRGHLADSKPRCPRCQVFISEETAEKERFVCSNCERAIFQYKPG